jgi:hypothetical protein
MMIPVVILFVVGMVALAGGAASWIVFALMMWAGLWLLFGGRRRRRNRMRHRRRRDTVVEQHVTAPLPPPMPQPLAPAPRPVVNLNRLPKDVEKQVDRIGRKAAVLGQHPERFPIGSRDLYVVQQTASDYLPTTVRTFLEVPSWSVDTPAADGRTPLQMLHAQLDMLEAKLDEIAETVRKQRVDNLLANERFLEDNFGSDSKAELTIPR